jgi:Integrase core domain
VYGPNTTPSLAGARYAMVFVDDYSRVGKVYFMRDHTAATIIEFTDKFIHDHAMVNGLHLQRLRTDCASEFLGEEYTEYCANSGVKRETSPPHDHARNGVAERRIKELTMIARCLLVESGLGPSLWAEAWEAANIIENITPSTAAPPGALTSMNAWTGNVTHLGKQRTFGAYAFVLIPKDKRTKMSANAWKGRVLSYNFDLQSWRVYRPDKNRVYVTSQVCFVESKVEALALTQPGINRIAARAAKHAKYSSIVHASNNNNSEHSITSEADTSSGDGDLLTMMRM